MELLVIFNLLLNVEKLFKVGLITVQPLFLADKKQIQSFELFKIFLVFKIQLQDLQVFHPPRLVRILLIEKFAQDLFFKKYEMVLHERQNLHHVKFM